MAHNSQQKRPNDQLCFVQCRKNMLNNQARQEELQPYRHNYNTNHTEPISNLDRNSNECDDNYNKSAKSESCSISLNNLGSLDRSDSYIAHILAHTIRSQDTDQFISVYDKIPETLTQTRVIIYGILIIKRTRTFVLKRIK